MDVVLRGRTHAITRESVEGVASEPPGSIQRYAVAVGGRSYPLKQVAARGIGVPPAAFTSQQAYQWLTKLGYDVIDTAGAHQ